MAKKYQFFLNFAQNSPTLAKHCQIWKHWTYKFCSSWSREPKRERRNDLLPERRNWLLPHDCRGEGISALAFLAFGALVLTLGPRSILFFRFFTGKQKISFEIRHQREFDFKSKRNFQIVQKKLFCWVTPLKRRNGHRNGPTGRWKS